MARVKQQTFIFRIAGVHNSFERKSKAKIGPKRPKTHQMEVSAHILI